MPQSEFDDSTRQQQQLRVYEAILSNTPDLMYVFDLKHRFIYANEGLLKLWGKTFDEAIGKTCLELGYEPWHAEMHSREIEQVVATKQQIRGEVPFTGAFGPKIYDYIFSPVLNSKGEVEAVSGTTRDVTDRKQAEDTLRESEEKYRTLFRSLDEGYCTIQMIFDDQGRPVDFRYLDVNPAHERQSGMSDPIGKTSREIVGELEQRWFDLFGQVAMTGETARTESWAEPLRRWFDVCAFRVGPKEALTVGVLFTDITRRKEAEETLKLNQLRQTFLLELDAALRAEPDARKLMAIAAELTGVYLNVDRVAYAEIDETETFFTVNEEHGAGTLPSLAGQHRLGDFGPSYIERLRTGETVNFTDTSVYASGQNEEVADAYLRAGVKSAIVIPLVKTGKFKAVFYVNHSQVRKWMPTEINVMRDVAERTWGAVERARAEEALRESELKYRTVFNSIDEGFCIIEMIFDENGKADDYRFIDVNPVFEFLTGLENVKGRRMREIVPSLEEFWPQTYGEVASTGKSVRFEHSAAPMNRWFDVHAARIGGEGSNRVALVFTNITERKISQKALVDSEERLRLVIENAREYAIVSMNLDRKVTGWNSGAERILGFQEEEIIGQDADIIFTQDDRNDGIPAREMKGALTMGRAADERWHLRKDGSRFWGSGAMMAMHDPSGEVVGLVKIFRDQTDERLAKEALERGRLELTAALIENKKAREEAEAASLAKDDFLAALSHELRTPLNPVLMTVTAMEADEGHPEEMRANLSMMRRNIELEARLIDDLLDITRIRRGLLEICVVACDVHELIEHATEIVRTDSHSKPLQIQYKLRAQDHVVMAEPARLQQVLWNLLKNAFKFTAAGGQILISTWNPAPGKIAISVEDNGIGISQESLERIFLQFDQGDLSGRHRFGGLGLGLTISKELIKLHGGELKVESDGPGRGATFTIELSVPDMAGGFPANEPAQSGSENSVSKTPPLRLLVVEDHKETLAAMLRLLGKDGHTVFSAENVEEALEVAERNRCDLLISDLGLPDGSGLTLMREIKKRYDLPGIALSGYGMPADVKEAEEAGFSKHLTKPISLGLLRSAFQEIFPISQHQVKG